MVPFARVAIHTPWPRWWEIYALGLVLWGVKKETIPEGRTREERVEQREEDANTYEFYYRRSSYVVVDKRLGGMEDPRIKD